MSNTQTHMVVDGNQMSNTQTHMVVDGNQMSNTQTHMVVDGKQFLLLIKQHTNLGFYLNHHF